VGSPGRVAAQQDLLVLDELAGQPGERAIEHADVVAGVVGAGVARPQQAGQRLTPGGPVGAVEVGEQRMKAEAALVGAGRPVLVGVRGDQRRVDVR
jgi:hypothetical protein